MPVDIFPDLSAPTVTVITEARRPRPRRGRAARHLPARVRRSTALPASGACVRSPRPGSRSSGRVRLGRGRLSRAAGGRRAPPGRRAARAGVERPELGPISSIMGEITFIALTSEPRRVRHGTPAPGRDHRSGGACWPSPGSPRSCRSAARCGSSRSSSTRGARAGTASPWTRSWTRCSRPRAHARPPASTWTAGQEYLVRGLGRARAAGRPRARCRARARRRAAARSDQIADGPASAPSQRGTAAYKATPAVVLSVQKQPGANTLELTREIDRVLDGSRAHAAQGRPHRAGELPPGRFHRGRGPQRRRRAARRRAPRDPDPVPVPGQRADHAHLRPGHSPLARGGDPARLRCSAARSTP